MPKNTTPTNPVTDLTDLADDLWERSGMQKRLFKEDGTREKHFSDIEDDEGHQYVDLVQEGGGTWGIALVGFTYILEKMARLRFVSLAGTSAGAINAIALAGVSDNVYAATGGTKSEKAIELLATKKFREFLDVKGFKGWFLNLLISESIWSKALLGILLLGFYLGVGFGVYSLLAWPITQYCCFDILDVKLLLYTIATICAFLPLVVMWFIFRWLLGSKMGFNSGVAFSTWLQNVLSGFLDENGKGVATTADLTMRMKPLTVTYHKSRALREKEDTVLERRLVIITTNITHGRIVKFPDRAKLYWKDPDLVPPHEYVRASMSVPFFFEVFEPSDDVIEKARFVDGGLLSNFPIGEFHNPEAVTPRYPTFGVKLEEDVPALYKHKLRLADYVGSFLNTFRSFHDDDFLKSHPEYNQLVSFISVMDKIDEKKYFEYINADNRNSVPNVKGAKTINWLQFDMEHETKKQLFRNGVLAAIKFLNDFNWVDYQVYRAKDAMDI